MTLFVLVSSYMVSVFFPVFSQTLNIFPFLCFSFAVCPSDSFWDSSAFETDTDLPSGWMRVRDTSGTYYWHIPTGTTQWEPPSPLGKVGDSMMSSTMSLETTPCEEPEVRSDASFTWIEAKACQSVETNIFSSKFARNLGLSFPAQTKEQKGNCGR